MEEEDDYLLWEGVHVTDAFADPATEPDAEHLCIAILGLEGLLPEIMSATGMASSKRRLSNSQVTRIP